MYTFLFPGQYANVMGYAIVVSVSLFFSVIPVSYTHLDVYKRQQIKLTLWGSWRTQ